MQKARIRPSKKVGGGGAAADIFEEPREFLIQIQLRENNSSHSLKGEEEKKNEKNNNHLDRDIVCGRFGLCK
jgi:hypothetical protein